MSQATAWCQAITSCLRLRSVSSLSGLRIGWDSDESDSGLLLWALRAAELIERSKNQPGTWIDRVRIRTAMLDWRPPLRISTILFVVHPSSASSAPAQAGYLSGRQ